MVAALKVETVERVVTFDAWKLALVNERLAKLAKTAAKLAVEPITLTILDRGMRRDVHQQSGLTFETETITARFEGDTPRLPGGWSFVGAVEHLEAGNMLHGDDPVMADFRMAPANCDHCKFTRARKKTVVLRRTEGEAAGNVVQVGSSCLKDFLGYHGSPERLIAMLDELSEFAEELDDLGGGWRRTDFGEPTDVFLTAVAASVRASGWSSKASGNFPTAEVVRHFLGHGSRLDTHSKDPWVREMASRVQAIKITKEDEEEAAKVRAWALTIPADTRDDYLGNVRVSLAGSVVLTKHFGIAASAVSARRKEEEREEKRAVVEGRKRASEYVGTVGERLFLQVRVVHTMDIFSDFGTKSLVIMEDGHGNTLKTFSSGDFGYYAKKDDEAYIKATVKEHSEYQGSKQTMLTRATVVEWLTIEDEDTNIEESK